MVIPVVSRPGFAGWGKPCPPRSSVPRTVPFPKLGRPIRTAAEFRDRRTPRLPSRNSNRRKAVGIEVSNNEGTDTDGGAVNSRPALTHRGVFNVSRRPRSRPSWAGRSRRPAYSLTAGYIESEAFRESLRAEDLMRTREEACRRAIADGRGRRTFKLSLLANRTNLAGIVFERSIHPAPLSPSQNRPNRPTGRFLAHISRVFELSRGTVCGPVSAHSKRKPSQCAGPLNRGSRGLSVCRGPNGTVGTASAL